MFSFEPKFVCVTTDGDTEYGAFMIYAGGSNMNGVGVSVVYYGVQHVAISGNSLQWYVTLAVTYNGNNYALGAKYQNNIGGIIYNYIAIG